MKYIIANWKMNMTLPQINWWLNGFEALLKNTKNTIIIAPSYIHIPLVKVFTDKYPNVKLAAQDIYEAGLGAHTGKVGATQVKEFCEYCIVGHSELNESTEIKSKKAELCVQNGIIPILCSKTPEQEWKNISEKYLLAWEDPNNISKNGIYNEKPLKEVKSTLADLFDRNSNNDVIYGGSVNENNSRELAKLVRLKGVLVGNASLNPETFWKIVESFELEQKAPGALYD